MRVLDFQETSQIVHMATAVHGLVAAIAKGARRANGSFQGGLTLGVLGEADLSPRRGAELELLRSFRVTDGLRGLRADLDRFAAGEYVIGLLRDLMRPALPAEALFLAGVTALKAISVAPPDSAASWVVWFEARALAASGHRLHLGSCVVCGEPVARDARLSPVAGGIVHGACAPEGPSPRLSPGDRVALERLYTARLPELVAGPMTAAEVRAARSIHDLVLPYVLDREPAGLRSLPRP